MMLVGVGARLLGMAQPNGGVKNPKIIGKCHKYKQVGHWKADCPNAKGKKKIAEGMALVT